MPNNQKVRLLRKFEHILLLSVLTKTKLRASVLRMKKGRLRHSTPSGNRRCTDCDQEGFGGRKGSC